MWFQDLERQVATHETGWDEIFQSKHFQMASGNFRLSGVAQFQSKQRFPISAYLKMLILAMGCLSSPHPVVSEICSEIFWLMSSKAGWNDGSFKHLWWNFENPDFQFAVVCVTVIDLLCLGQDCIYRAWSQSIAARSFLSHCVVWGGHFNGWRVTQVKNQT